MIHNNGYCKAYEEDNYCDDALGIKGKFSWINGGERADYQSEYRTVCSRFALLKQNAYDLGGNEESDDCTYAVIDNCNEIKLAYGSDSVVIAAENFSDKRSAETRHYHCGGGKYCHYDNGYGVYAESGAALFKGVEKDYANCRKNERHEMNRFKLSRAFALSEYCGERADYNAHKE